MSDVRKDSTTFAGFETVEEDPELRDVGSIQEQNKKPRKHGLPLVSGKNATWQGTLPT